MDNILALSSSLCSPRALKVCCEKSHEKDAVPPCYCEFVRVSRKEPKSRMRETNIIETQVQGGARG